MRAVRRVLVYRLGSLGDMLVAMPSLHLVRHAFPQAEIRLLTNFPVNAKAAPASLVLSGTGLVDSYERYAVGTRNLRELAALWWRLVRFRADVLVYLGPARGVAAAKRDAQFFRVCGMTRQVGVPVTEGLQQNFFGAETPDRLAYWEPEAARLARNILALGDAQLKDAASWDIHLSADEKAVAEAAVGFGAMPRIAVSVGTKVQSKDWGRENWRALLMRLAPMLVGHALVMVGSPEEAEASEFAAEGWRAAGGGPVVNLCGKLTPRESGAALATAKLFIGHDSGPMQLAAAVGTPCVAVFAARNVPRVWFPFGERHRVVYHAVNCMGCGLETCTVEGKKCILSITVDEVVVAVGEVLSSKF
jgi:ADP-heptose:LPS heptosyltransferase